MHRFLGFLRLLARPYAPLLSGPGDRYMSVTWPLQGTGPLEGRNDTGLWGLRCVGKGTEAGWGAGRSELASHSLPGSATQAAEQSDNSPNAVMCHVTVVS